MIAVQRPGAGPLSQHWPASRWPADAELLRSLNPDGVAPREAAAADENNHTLILGELGELLDRFIAATTPTTVAPAPVA